MSMRTLLITIGVVVAFFVLYITTVSANDYIVKKGDTLYKIAKKYKAKRPLVLAYYISTVNGINPDKIEIGDIIVIPKNRKLSFDKRGRRNVVLGRIEPENGITKKKSYNNLRHGWIISAQGGVGITGYKIKQTGSVYGIEETIAPTFGLQIQKRLQIRNQDVYMGTHIHSNQSYGLSLGIGF